MIESVRPHFDKRVFGEARYFPEGLRQKLIEKGPAALRPTEHFALLWDAKSLRWLHHEFSNSADPRPRSFIRWWKERLKEVVERIGLTR